MSVKILSDSTCDLSKELIEKYNAKNCARLVMEAAEVYEKRGILL